MYLYSCTSISYKKDVSCYILLYSYPQTCHNVARLTTGMIIMPPTSRSPFDCKELISRINPAIS